jgi:acyl carrier protein
MPITSQSIRTYINDKLGVDTSDINDQTPLFSFGLIAPFGLVDLILFLESDRGFKIAPELSFFMSCHA